MHIFDNIRGKVYCNLRAKDECAPACVFLERIILYSDPDLVFRKFFVKLSKRLLTREQLYRLKRMIYQAESDEPVESS